MTATGMLQKVYYSLSYRFGFAEWDIGSAQPDLVRLVESGGIRGKSVLDVGCGSGNNAIYLASKGYSVTGIDASANGIKAARGKAKDAGNHIEFLVADVLNLPYYVRIRHQLAKPFDCIVDCGLFHGFRGQDINAYERNLASVLKPEGQLIIHCFNDQAPSEPFGPRKVTREELESIFSEGWVIEELQPAKMQSRKTDVPAWLVSLQRTGRAA